RNANWPSPFSPARMMRTSGFPRKNCSISSGSSRQAAFSPPRIEMLARRHDVGRRCPSGTYLMSHFFPLSDARSVNRFEEKFALVAAERGLVPEQLWESGEDKITLWTRPSAVEGPA